MSKKSSSQALYRKYRTKKLADIVGQSHITDVLAGSLKKGLIAHAYLLTGPRGVGKTSIARILAHEINQLPYNDDSSHLDIIEIDAASNNGVEDVRDLRDKVQIAPTSAPRKVYIIDEVHMLSKPAFNALLKTLEEPPEHIVFILATTDVDKLPSTIISRTQRFTFRAATSADTVRHLANIAQQEKIAIDKEALELIARHGDGSFRDSISLLDQLQSLSDGKTAISVTQVEQALGLAPQDLVQQLLTGYLQKDLEAIMSLLQDANDRGVAAATLARQLADASKRELITSPQLITLLDTLLDVTRSTDPDIKLLTTLAAHAIPKTKSAALDAVSPVAVSAPLRQLEKRAVEAPLPSTIVNTPNTLPSTDSQKAIKNTSDSLDWRGIVDHARQHYVAIFSVVSKCVGELHDGQLIVYTRNNFYKKKLDDPKHRINFVKCLEAVGLNTIDIVTVAQSAPLKNSQAAAVAAIMGGGEEVALDE